MKILFLTTGEFNHIQQAGIYSDLLRTFMNHGHEVFIVSAREKREHLQTELKLEGHAKHLLVNIGNLTKTNLIEKGISTVLIEHQYRTAIKRFFANEKFDLVLYSTPPITLAGVVKYVKERDGAKTYLMLKDIFPQNAVDIGMMSKAGLKGLIYRYFRAKEKAFYAISDHIGCMSQANVDYVIKNNPEVDPNIVEICPNSIEAVDMRVDEATRKQMRNKYNIPLDKKIFVYGGNLGKPQGIPFLIKCLEKCKDLDEAFFLIVGDGTEYGLLEEYYKNSNQKNMKLMKRLPKEDYDQMVAACDVGMIFLDHRFTIPNFPSRLLSYMQAGLPVLACTDPNTDMGDIVEKNGFGWKCMSNNTEEFEKCIEEALSADIGQMGMLGNVFLKNNYSVQRGYKIIMKHFDSLTG